MTRLVVIALTALVALAVPALAQDARPMPACGGVTGPDTAGDAFATYPIAGSASGQKAPDNFDITQAFFRTDGKDVTANFQVVNLDRTRVPGWDAMGYWVFYHVGETERFALAATDGGDWKYYYGTQSSDGFLVEGESKGKAFEGANGVMQVQLSGALNKTLTQVRFISVSMLLAKGDPIFGSQPLTYSVSDTAPDGGGGDDYVAKPCTTDPVGGGGGAVTTTLKARAPSLKASKLKKGKKFSISLTASGGEVKNITARLVKGSKAVAKGKLGSLSGSGKLSLKVSGKVKKGAYKLLVKGTDAAGKAVSTSSKVKVK